MNSYFARRRVHSVISVLQEVYWFSLNWRKSVGAVDTLFIGRLRFKKAWGNALNDGGSPRAEGLFRPRANIRRTPGRLSLARRTPPELAFVSPVGWIIGLLLPPGKVELAG